MAEYVLNTATNAPTTMMSTSSVALPSDMGLRQHKKQSSF
jgi:hypothetical protein